MTRKSRTEHILVVDDSEMTLEVIRRNLEARGYRMSVAGHVPGAMEILEQTPVDLVITDLKMPGTNGLDLVRHVRENLRDTEVMMITGYATVGGAVEAMKRGAEEYLAKPFTDEELCDAVSRALDGLRSRRLARSATEAEAAAGAPTGLIGNSGAMKDVYRAIGRCSQSMATVLVTGESGTGKELVARAIHYEGNRAACPFVPVNCCSIPETLLESELFGHVKGAFSGATSSRAGFFQSAEGGTIFLDEIGDTSLPMQARLLRVLQDRRVTMVGSSRPREVDVRIIAATNKDLEAQVRQGAFREDLFFRLNVLTVHVPPVRERGDDVLLLASHFARKFASDDARQAPRFSAEALRALRRFSWPGNVREVENAIHRLVVMCDSDLIDLPHLPRAMRFSMPGSTVPGRTLTEVEVEHIRNVLAAEGGNKSRAAKVLGIDRKTLREKLKRLAPLGET